MARWVTVFGLQFQFSEIAKILMIVVLANWIASRPAQRMGGPWTIIGAGLLVAPAMVLVLMQPDLGHVARLRRHPGRHALPVRRQRALAGALRGHRRWPRMPFIWNYILRDYQKQRLTSFLDPAADPLGSGYQLVQSRIAVGSGGLFGKGITNGTQNQLDFLPVQTTDFVYAILAEELGLHRRHPRARALRRPALARPARGLAGRRIRSRSRSPPAWPR